MNDALAHMLSPMATMQTYMEPWSHTAQDFSMATFWIRQSDGAKMTAEIEGSLSSCLWFFLKKNWVEKRKCAKKHQKTMRCAIHACNMTHIYICMYKCQYISVTHISAISIYGSHGPKKVQALTRRSSYRPNIFICLAHTYAENKGSLAPASLWCRCHVARLTMGTSIIYVAGAMLDVAA